MRSRGGGGWPRPDGLRSTLVALRVLRRCDQLTSYRVGTVARAHLLAIAELYERSTFDEALDAAEAVCGDLAALDRGSSRVALRARAERARSLARLDRVDEAVEALAEVLGDAARSVDVDVPWRLSCRLALAVMRRDAGELAESSRDLRALVTDVIDEFGQESSWLVATVTELATNVALDGDPATAIEMAAALLPGATTRLGPLSRDALTLRSRIARWSIAEHASGARGERLAAAAIVDFTRAGLATCAEACELRYVLADATYERGELDYAIAQLASLCDDLDESTWAASSFADLARTELEEWRERQHGSS